MSYKTPFKLAVGTVCGPYRIVEMIPPERGPRGGPPVHKSLCECICGCGRTAVMNRYELRLFLRGMTRKRECIRSDSATIGNRIQAGATLGFPKATAPDAFVLGSRSQRDWDVNRDVRRRS